MIITININKELSLVIYNTNNDYQYRIKKMNDFKFENKKDLIKLTGCTC